MAKNVNVKLQPKRKAPVAKTLAHYGDPYVAASGKIIQPETLDTKEDVAKTAASKSFKSKTKRTIKELPAQPNVLRGISCVFVYTVLGLSDREIAELLAITVVDVRRVRQHAGYAEVFGIVSQEFISANSALLESRIASYANDALTNVHQIAQHGVKEDTKLRANIDLLDRGGIRPKDVEGRRNQQGAELRIIISKGDALEVNGVTVDV